MSHKITFPRLLSESRWESGIVHIMPMNDRDISQKWNLGNFKIWALVIVLVVVTSSAAVIRQANSSARIHHTAALAACANAGSGFGTVTSVDEAYPSTAQAVQKWADKSFPVPPSSPALSFSLASASVAVCYISGTFGSTLPTLGQAISYKSIIVTVDETSGATNLALAGRSGQWAFSPPPSS